MYQMKSIDISMIIILEINRKRQNYILGTVLFFLIDFQRSKGGFVSCRKKLE